MRPDSLNIRRRKRTITVSQQYNKHIKRRRHVAYLKRKKLATKAKKTATAAKPAAPKVEAPATAATPA